MKTPSQISAHKFLKFFFIGSLFLPAAAFTEPKVVNLKSILPNIEVADNFSSRRRGLMFRSSLQSNTACFLYGKTTLQDVCG